MYQAIIVLSLFTLLSCSPKSVQENKIIKSSVVNGKEVQEKDLINASVVGVYNIRDNSICTGSLIAPNVVMTAAHCIPNNPQNLKIVFAINIDEAMSIREEDVLHQYVLPAIEFKVGTSWDPTDETTEVDTGDIALIKFKGTIPLGYKPATFLPDAADLKVGQVVTLAGYGVSIVDTQQIDPRKYRNIEQAIEYGEVFCSGTHKGNYGTCYRVEMSGDGILRTASAPISVLYDTEVRLNEKKAGTCNGDSGGPAYIEKDGIFYLFGVTSRGSELCNEAGIYTNALFYKGWIEETVKAFNK